MDWKPHIMSGELLCIADALTDPMVQAVMQADRVEPADLEALLVDVAAKISSRRAARLKSPPAKRLRSLAERALAPEIAKPGRSEVYKRD